MNALISRNAALLLALSQLQSTWAMALVPRSVSCSYSYPASSGDTCQSFSSDWGLSVQQFEAINPGVNCPDLVSGQSYCVLGSVSSVGGSTTSASSTISSKPTTSSSPTTSSKPTTTATTLVTSTSSTSAPYQPQATGTAANCDKFFLVQSGDSCGTIEKQFDISAGQFLAWNPSVNSDCTNILAGYYYCIHVPGATTPLPTTTVIATTTTPADGITTPTPYQAGMVDNCNKFHLVQSGDNCYAIAKEYSIPLSTFYKWNPAIGTSCSTLYLGYYVCVDTIGYSSPSKTTSAGNGITTPTPYEPGMVGDCKKFYLVKSGDYCAAIASSQGVTVSDIEKWNPKVGSSCTDLWLGDYICVEV